MRKNDLKIQKQSATDLVCDQMKEMITSGNWSVGTKIPSENELAEIFGVNRLTVRIAIQRLNALGVLYTRTGEGSFVQQFNFDSLLSDLSDFYYSPSVLEKVSEFRQIIETECIRRVVARSEVDLSEVEKFCLLFQDEVSHYYELTDLNEKSNSLRLSVEHTLAMQTELCKLADNELLLWSFSLAKALVNKHALEHATFRINEIGEDKKNVWIRNHWALIEAIKTKDEGEAIRLINLIIGSVVKLNH